MDQLGQIQEENQRLRKAVEELSILNDLARIISSTIGLDGVIETIVKRSLRSVQGEQGAIILVDELSPTEAKTLIRAQTSSSTHEQFHLNQNILGWMIINKRPLLSNDISADSRFAGVQKNGDIRSILCAPLLVKNKLIGILSIYNKKQGSQFSDDDQRLLAIIATQSGQVIENSRLYEQEKDKMAMEKELSAAREVQMSLLPKSLPRVQNIEFAASTVPAKEVGGDYYDFIHLPDNAYEVVIADVAGKGLPAALLSSMAKGIIYAQSLQSSSPQQQLIGCNRIIRNNFPRKSFITMLIVVVNPETRHITMSNAGHCFPIVFRKATNTVEVLKIKGVALNFMDSLVCTELAIELQPEDALIIYSDGVDEAQNKAGQFYGVERLQEIIARDGGRSAQELLQAILDDVKLYTKDAAQSDDITLLIMKAVT